MLARIYELCDGRHGEEQIAKAISDEFEVDYSESIVDLRRALKELEMKGLVIGGSVPDLPRAQRLMSHEVKLQPTDGSYLRSPLSAYWEATKFCNLRCLHCYVDSCPLGSEWEADLNTDEAKGMIKQLAGMRVFDLFIGGGEPLLRRDLLEIARFATERKVRVSIASNGALINRRIARKLRKLQVSVQISLNGATEKTHDFLAGVPGAFRAAINGLRNLAEEGMHTITVNTVFLRSNQHDLERMYRLLSTLKVRFWRFMHFMPCGRGRKNRRILEPRPEDYANLLAFVLDKNRMYFEEGTSLWIDDNLNFLFLQNGCAIKGSGRSLGCTAGRTHIYISAGGSVLPCGYLRSPNFVVGNAKSCNLRSLWMKSKVFQLFRHIDHINGKCGECNYLPVCKGGCRAIAYLNSGNIYDSDTSCWYEPHPHRED